MRMHTKLIARTVLLLGTGWFAACNSYIDDEPNVVLEIETLTSPPVSGSINTVTGECIFTIVNASALFKNKPKNALAGSSVAPFNDIVLQRVSIDYVWDDGAALSGVIFGVSGTVPSGGQVASQFPLVNATVLNSGVTPRDGHTAQLSITAYGMTVAGEPVVGRPFTGGNLSINSCI